MQAAASPCPEESHLEELEETLRSDPLRTWMKLRVFSDQTIAVGWYRYRGEKQSSTTVCIFTASTVCWMGGRDLSVNIIEETVRKFRKNQRGTAKWYFKELCRAFKDGICVVNGNKRTSLGKWD